MELRELHTWEVAPAGAIALQRQLAGHIVHDQPLPLSAIRFVAGVDVSVRSGISQAAVVVLRFPDLTPVETARCQMPTPFPYIPGLLSFREGPALVEAFRRLKQPPDVFIFDGMGRAHPRRFGIACHMGLWLGRPAIGCGKTHFVGEYAPPSAARGAWSPLTDGGELIGAVLCTRAAAKPVFISVGHQCDLPSALALVMACTGKYRLPEPIRAAHHAAGDFAQES